MSHRGFKLVPGSAAVLGCKDELCSFFKRAMETSPGHWRGSGTSGTGFRGGAEAYSNVACISISFPLATWR
jgi:hypothetical protein